MIFASFEFLCLFLPLFFAAYFLTPFRHRNWPILILSWAFYAWWRVDFLLLLVFCTVFTFYTVRFMDQVGPRTRPGTWLLVVGLAGNLGVLAYFKYANFGVAAFNDLRAAAVRRGRCPGRRSSCRSASPSTCCNPSPTWWTSGAARCR